MGIWLIYPAAKCTFTFVDETPIASVSEDTDVSQADAARVQQGTGFFGKTRDAAKQCYAENPPRGQAPWKQQVAGGLLAGVLVFWLIGQFTKPPKTFV